MLLRFLDNRLTDGGQWPCHVENTGYCPWIWGFITVSTFWPLPPYLNLRKWPKLWFCHFKTSNSSAGIATGYGLEHLGSILGFGKIFFSSLHRPDGLGANPAAYPIGNPVKWSEREADPLLHLVPRLWPVELHLFSAYAFIGRCFIEGYFNLYINGTERYSRNPFSMKLLRLQFVDSWATLSVSILHSVEWQDEWWMVDFKDFWRKRSCPK
jgi:hypothetical protein